MNLIKLASFLLNANKLGYGNEDHSNWIKEEDGSTSIIYKEKDWRMNDNFFGGEPFGGRLVVFIKNKPSWMFVYYGYILDNNTLPVKQIYKFLQEALINPPKDFPVRGPKMHVGTKLSYQNSWQGKIDRFSGKEKIYKDGKEVYKANYFGGIINS